MGTLLVNSSVTTQKFTLGILRTLYLLRICRCPISLNASLQRGLCTSRILRGPTQSPSERGTVFWVLQQEMSRKFKHVCPKESRRKAALKFLGHCEFRRRMKYWGSRWGKKKKVSETFTKGFGFFLFRECGFRRTNKRHHWHYMVDELSVRRTEDCGRQTTAHFHDVLRKEQEELSWEQVTPISSSSVNF